MSELFDICVDTLYWIGDLTGLGYRAANIWIFVIIHPAITLFLLGWVLKLKFKKR